MVVKFRKIKEKLSMRSDNVEICAFQGNSVRFGILVMCKNAQPAQSKYERHFG